MIVAYADASMDAPICSVGYVLFRTEKGNEEFLDLASRSDASQASTEQMLDAGTRLLNINECQRDIDWTIEKAEFWAAIIATRAAFADLRSKSALSASASQMHELDYASDTLLLHMDPIELVGKIKRDEWSSETYFTHTFYSFANRFNNWHITRVDRSNNEAAHKQVRSFAKQTDSERICEANPRTRIGLKVGRDLRKGVL